MKKLKPNIDRSVGAGWLYFYIHLVTEISCFYILSQVAGNTAGWCVPFIYDCLAFVPQALIGRLCDRFRKLNISLIGTALIIIAVLEQGLFTLPGKYTALVVLCLGNACTHIGGAEVTLRCSHGRLTHPAVFVAGGSFGVISGKLLAGAGCPYWFIAFLMLSAVPFILLAETYVSKDSPRECEYNFCSDRLPAGLIVALATVIVAVRGYMGYGIPTAWNKTTFQTVMLYVFMGIGKASGGIIADKIGVRKTAILSSLAALPFLFAGNERMMISLIGVMFFSMTMSITLALIASALKGTPGLAFGFTTIGLFIGTAPIFFFHFTSTRSNCIIIAVLTALCTAAFLLITRKDEKHNEGLSADS